MTLAEIREAAKRKGLRIREAGTTDYRCEPEYQVYHHNGLEPMYFRFPGMEKHDPLSNLPIEMLRQVFDGTLGINWFPNPYTELNGTVDDLED